MILFVKHIAIEGPETLGEFFRRQGFDSRTVELWRVEALPANLDGLEAVVCLGGPMNVYEEEAHPYLQQEDVFIRRILNDKIPFLGICLGSQLLAKAGGAQVSRAPQSEIGFYDVHLTEAGTQDPFFAGITSPLKVFQWHGDTFAVPGPLLVEGDSCRNQAFRLGPNAYGLQFHIEITEQSIRNWCAAYLDLRQEAGRARLAGLVRGYRDNKEIFHQTAEEIYNNFSQIIRGSS